MKIFVVGGSSRNKESRSNVVVDQIASIFSGKVSVWKLAERQLPLAKHEWHKNPALSEDDNVIGFAKEIENSQVVVLVSPIYNGSYTAHLKNALDCIDGAAFAGKTIVLVSVGSDATAILPALHMQDVARTMRGLVYPRFIVVNQSQINTEDRVVDDSVSTRIQDVVNGAIELSKK